MALVILPPSPPASSDAVRASMRGNRRRDTKPELDLRSALHRAGLRFRVDLPVVVPGVRVRPDVVFTKQRVAVFVDSCFFHVCPDHGHVPKSNTHYWIPKLQRNVDRDRRNNELLATAGWQVVRVWQHLPIDDAVALVAFAVVCGSRQ